jgi:hypothetical protein
VDALGDVMIALSVALRIGAEIDGLFSDKRETDSRRRFVGAKRASQATS